MLMSCAVRDARPVRSSSAAGELGPPSARQLAAAGSGARGLLGCGRVELSTVRRQVRFGGGVIAKPKAEAGRERLARLSPGIRVVAHAIEQGRQRARGARK